MLREHNEGRREADVPGPQMPTNNGEAGHRHQEEEGGDKEHKLQALESAMMQLNDKQRVCIDLFYLQQKTYDEVSNQTGYTSNEVKSYIQNGKRNLKNTLAQKGILFSWAIALWIQHTA